MERITLVSSRHAIASATPGEQVSSTTAPNTPITVSRLCLGCQQFSGSSDAIDLTWGATDQESANEIVLTALQEGINFFDCAECYGKDNHAERVLGEALKWALPQAGLTRHDVVIASKFGKHRGEDQSVYTADDIETALKHSLECLQLTYIDLYQVHWYGYMHDIDETVAVLTKLRDKGRLIREYGVCNFGLENMRTFVDGVEGHEKRERGSVAPFPTNQLPYNLLWRGIEKDVVPLCDELGVKILAYSSLQQGLLSGRFTEPLQVPEGRRRTKLFSSTSTATSRHGQSGAEVETFAAIKALQELGDRAGFPLTQLAMSWLLSQPSVGCVIVGASTPDQVRSNAEAMRNWKNVGGDVLRECTELTDSLRQRFDGVIDMWALTSRIA